MCGRRPNGVCASACSLVSRTPERLRGCGVDKPQGGANAMERRRIVNLDRSLLLPVVRCGRFKTILKGISAAFVVEQLQQFVGC